jgi:hypothetical protein
MNIELKPDNESRLQIIADAQSLTVTQLASKEKAVEEIRELMRTNTATLDRASTGNPTMRELMHEGHKY